MDKRDTQSSSDKLIIEPAGITAPQYTKKQLKYISQKHKHIEFASGFIMNMLLRLAAPNIVSYAATGLYSIVDSMFIGNGAGTVALTGLGLFQPIECIITYIIAVYPCNGAGVIIAEALGKGQIKRAEAVLTQCVAICFLLVVAFAAVVIPFMSQILYFLGASDEVEAETRGYGYVLTAGAFAISLNNGLGPLLRTEHKATLAMWRLILFSILNTAIDPLMIFVLDLGLMGAGVSTILSAALVGGALLVWYVNPRSSATCHIRPRYLHPRNIAWGDVGRMLLVSLPTALGGAVTYLLPFFINLVIKKFVTDASADAHIAAVGTTVRVFIALTAFVMGFSYGLVPIFGYNLSRGRWARCFNTLASALFWSLVLSVAFQVVILALAPYVARSFSADADFNAVAPRDMRIILSSFGFFVVPFFGLMAVSAEQRVPQSVLCAVSKIGFIIPLAYLLPRLFEDKVTGILLSFPASDVLAFCVSLFAVVPLFRRYKVRARDEDDADALYTLRSMLSCFQVRRTAQMKREALAAMVAAEEGAQLESPADAVQDASRDNSLADTRTDLSACSDDVFLPPTIVADDA
eukprot:gnl/Chilomastix_cuspidata/2373.p1 GENE.gnl/Chilomastix_cuspidata/2373~~gnl/Chilomastix_cuspidata/2373.p1  ORF type:complete len:578 (-),score=264.68 gnl/Chilomastix_cuspidata/2373:394-2127(-)